MRARIMPSRIGWLCFVPNFVRKLLLLSIMCSSVCFHMGFISFRSLEVVGNHLLFVLFRTDWELFSCPLCHFFFAVAGACGSSFSYNRLRSLCCCYYFSCY